MSDQPSKYQQSIYDAVTAGSGDIIVQAIRLLSKYQERGN